MFVDDHNLMFGGGSKNTVTVRISPEELTNLSGKKILIGQNDSGNKLRVVLMVEDDPRETSAS